MEKKNLWNNPQMLYSQYESRKVELSDNTNLLFAMVKELDYTLDAINKVTSLISESKLSANAQNKEFRKGCRLMREGIKKVLADIMFETLNYTNGREI